MRLNPLPRPFRWHRVSGWLDVPAPPSCWPRAAKKEFRRDLTAGTIKAALDTGIGRVVGAVRRRKVISGRYAARGSQHDHGGECPVLGRRRDRLWYHGSTMVVPWWYQSSAREVRRRWQCESLFAILRMLILRPCLACCSPLRLPIVG